MIEDLIRVPKRTAIVHKLEGDVFYVGESTKVGDVVIPKRFEHTLDRRTQSYESLAEALGDKNLYLRGKLDGDNVEWFGLVTDQFKEINLEEIESIGRQVTGESPRIRYNRDRERFQLQSKVSELADGTGVYLSIDSGDFGTYGGNGQMAARVGLATYNPDTDAWMTMHTYNVDQVRVIHKKDETPLDEATNQVLEDTVELDDRIEASKGVIYGPRAVAEYAAITGQKCRAKKALARVAESVDGPISAFDLAGKIVQECKDLAGSTQMRMENIAGEVIYFAGDVAASYAA